ncbi:hypothetical protein [Aquimarina pacifica]|uniref:hypothetical protein n=1 Tax=Aquimarina pacifica TaxID=1296415 RepID=UPI00047074F2|nr:hypothetical protein [Aquimarina pacifica]
MRTSITVFFIMVSVLITNAQTKTVIETVRSNSDHKSENQGYQVNISIANDEEEYTLEASFPSDKTQQLKRYLDKHLDIIKIKDKVFYYGDETNGSEKKYQIKLKKGKLIASLDKNNVDTQFEEKFINIFNSIQDIVK